MGTMKKTEDNTTATATSAAAVTDITAPVNQRTPEKTFGAIIGAILYLPLPPVQAGTGTKVKVLSLTLSLPL